MPGQVEMPGAAAAAAAQAGLIIQNGIVTILLVLLLLIRQTYKCFIAEMEEMEAALEQEDFLLARQFINLTPFCLVHMFLEVVVVAVALE
jgi:hypothetical protein